MHRPTSVPPAPPSPPLHHRRQFLRHSLFAGAGAWCAVSTADAQTGEDAATEKVRERLRGNMASIVPAFRADYSLDLDSVGRWAEFMGSERVPVLFQSYGDGELYNLQAAEAEAIVKTVAQRVQGRSLVIGGTTYGSTLHLVDMTRRLQDAGADAVNLHLYNQDEEEIYRAIAEVAEKTRVPLVAYESKWSMGLVQRLAKLPRVIGMKCHAELYQYYAYIRGTRQQRFGVLGAGQMKHFLFGYLIGSPAYLCPLTPFAPGLGRNFYQALTRGDVEGARQVVYDHEEPLMEVTIPLGYPNAYKCGLHLAGFYESIAMRPPKRTNAPGELDKLRAYMADRKLLKQG